MPFARQSPHSKPENNNSQAYTLTLTLTLTDILTPAPLLLTILTPALFVSPSPALQLHSARQSLLPGQSLQVTASPCRSPGLFCRPILRTVTHCRYSNRSPSRRASPTAAHTLSTAEAMGRWQHSRGSVACAAETSGLCMKVMRRGSEQQSETVS